VVLAVLVCLSEKDQVDAFLPISHTIPNRPTRSKIIRTCHYYSSSSFHGRLGEEDDDDDDDDNDEDDCVLDPDSLGDWRDFRRNLAMSMKNSDDAIYDFGSKVSVQASVSKENEEVLASQNEALAEEFIKGVWAHKVSTVCLCSGLTCLCV
jgi:hypothetical protein